MPITPIHMGPGMMVKAAVPRHFSIIVFGLTQVALDLEVLFYIITWNPPLHRFWHTYLGASIVALIFTVLGKPLSQFIKSFWNNIASRCHDADLSVPVKTSWFASFSASFIGAYSHIYFDSLFHSYFHPLQPWSANNPFFGSISPMELQGGCLLLGVIGLALFFAREIKRRKSINQDASDRVSELENE